MVQKGREDAPPARDVHPPLSNAGVREAVSLVGSRGCVTMLTLFKVNRDFSFSIQSTAA